MIEQSDKAEALVQLGHYLYDKAYASGGAGNLSLRIDAERFLFTPSGASLGSLKTHQLPAVHLDGRELKEPHSNSQQVGRSKATKEAEIHLAIYRQRPQANVIIHLHSTYLTALSCLKGLDPKNAIQAFTPYVVMRVGDLPVIPYYRPGSPSIAESISPLASQYPAFLLANHGIIIAGNSISEACYNFEELEETAKLYFLLRGSDTQYLSSEQIHELRQMKK